MHDLRSRISWIPDLCSGNQSLLEQWLDVNPRSSLLSCIPAILLGCGAYGFTIGMWQGWEMASYVSIKLPLVIFATLLINGVINGMLAMVIGSGISLRQSMQFLLAGFGLMAIILGSLSPVALLLALHAPSPGQSSGASLWHSVTLLTHTSMIAYAGIISHRSLLRHLRTFAKTPTHGTQTFFAWLAGNLLVGGQVSWIMRPFFGSPGLEIELFRANPMDGSFYEAILKSLINILGL